MFSPMVRFLRILLGCPSRAEAQLDGSAAADGPSAARTATKVVKRRHSARNPMTRPLRFARVRPLPTTAPLTSAAATIER